MKAVITLVLAAVVCATPAAFAKKKTTTTDTLFSRLGGKKAIVAVVDDFVGNCATDNRISSFFSKTAGDPKRLAKFKTNLVNQICEAAGGPCKYTGKDMKTAHAGMGITSTHFDALVEDLTKSLDKFKVAETDKSTLLGVLGPMKSDIVTSTAKAEQTEGTTQQ